MNNHRQLTEQDRVFISLMLGMRYSKDKIADIIGVHRSTIFREIKRNIIRYTYHVKFYDGHLAHRKMLFRRIRNTKLDKHADLKRYVYSKLESGWSPWQIEGRLRRENNGTSILSHETIYRHIYSNFEIRNRFFKKLRRKHFNRVIRGTRRKKIIGLPIKSRPKDINNREKYYG